MGIGQPGHEDPQDIEAREEHLLLRVRQLADDQHEAERVLIEVVKERDGYRAALADLVAAIGPTKGRDIGNYEKAVAALRDGFLGPRCEHPIIPTPGCPGCEAR